MSEDVNGASMTCQELVELVTAYLEGVMDADRRALFERHLEECRGCRNYLDQFRVTVRTVGQIDEGALDPTFRDRLLQAFRNWSS